MPRNASEFGRDAIIDAAMGKWTADPSAPDSKVVLTIFCAGLCLSLYLWMAGGFPYSFIGRLQEVFGVWAIGLHVAAIVSVAALPAAAVSLVLRLHRHRSRAVSAADPVLYLAHHDNAHRVLRYDSQAGIGTELPRTQVRKPLRRGFYVGVSGGIAGLYASPEGPIFFLDSYQRQNILTLDAAPRLWRALWFVARATAGRGTCRGSQAPEERPATEGWRLIGQDQLALVSVRVRIDGTCRAVVTEGRRRNVFDLFDGDRHAIGLSYEQPADIGAHDPSFGDMGLGEAERDFFVWLSQTVGSPELSSAFTLVRNE